MKRVIKWCRVSQWGRVREFVHPDSAGAAEIILRLTGKRTIDGVTRELLRDLTAGLIVWEEVLAP